VIAKRGQRRVLLEIQDKRSTTALLAAKVSLTWHDQTDPARGVSAVEATHLPSTLVFAHKAGTGATMLKKLRKDAEVLNKKNEPQLRVESTQKGWVNESVFLNWIDSLPAASGGPTFLVFDSYGAHVTPEVERRCDSRNFVPFVIPGGCTGKLQVHDTHVNQPLKARLRKGAPIKGENVHDERL
jgi:hypothetical protein